MRAKIVKSANGVTRFNVSKTRFKKILIPIPCPNNPEKSLHIQQEIVRILDAFTELTTELTTELNAELNARKKQYQYYRDQLLNFKEGERHPYVEKLLDGAEVEWKALGEVIKTVTSPAKIKKKDYRATGNIPIIDQGSKFIAGYTNENLTPIDPGEYIVFGDHTEHIKYVNFAFVQGADGLKILKPISDNAKYLYYAFQNFYQKKLGYERHWKTAKKTLIPIPCPNNPEKSLAIQQEIVRILDKFDTLTNSITEGLPREIELRQKQYEYYRDLIFNFLKQKAISSQRDNKESTIKKPN